MPWGCYLKAECVVMNTTLDISDQKLTAFSAHVPYTEQPQPRGFPWLLSEFIPQFYQFSRCIVFHCGLCWCLGMGKFQGSTLYGHGCSTFVLVGNKSLSHENGNFYGLSLISLFLGRTLSGVPQLGIPCWLRDSHGNSFSRAIYYPSVGPFCVPEFLI